MAAINETAFEAANQWSKQVGADLPASVILGVIQAAQPHLQPGLVASPKPVHPLDYPKYWSEDERNSDRDHRVQLARVDAAAEFRRGVAIGRAEREAELLDAQVLHAEAGPTEGELWREALALTARLWSGQTEAVTDADQRRDFIETALWFHLNLQHPPGEGDPGVRSSPNLSCLHCGRWPGPGRAHAKDCPNDDAPQISADSDDQPPISTETTYPEGHSPA